MEVSKCLQCLRKERGLVDRLHAPPISSSDDGTAPDTKAPTSHHRISSRDHVTPEGVATSNAQSMPARNAVSGTTALAERACLVLPVLLYTFQQHFRNCTYCMLIVSAYPIA